MGGDWAGEQENNITVWTYCKCELRPMAVLSYSWIVLLLPPWKMYVHKEILLYIDMCLCHLHTATSLTAGQQAIEQYWSVYTTYMYVHFKKVCHRQNLNKLAVGHNVTVTKIS